ncbi:hypothetical protein GSI_03766 [Ganoderma sinense ZZ0214-1]|uniref:Uncharacterized protein n=1 Tax=Ganoderma sinense ZZ0214-1 TaxID=1077348 RepID=A0A2G8SJZ0_9APHY|nr:hypothetical protein GSI_03766 [Ganoderma sinense ZZ0214-1]
MDASPPLSIPRLRLPRHSPPYKDQALTPVAGPSHNPDFLHADDDDDDAESTPRMSASAMLDKHSPRTVPSSGLPTETPTDRLRALLARIPNSPDGGTPHASSSRPPFALPSTSEPDSDFEPPHSVAATPSIARESLKELFSNALREPGNTPRRVGRPRRNSIDASEVETSMGVEEERAKYKAKRLSLSDEEAEKSRRTEPSARSTRSSAASAFDALRQRLNQSGSAMPSLSQDQMVIDTSLPPPNSSIDTALPERVPVDHSSETPPRATSTPMRTFQMSANFNMHSNLLDQDSEMQHALQGMDSYDSGPIAKHRHSTPSLKDSAGPIPRPQSCGTSATPRPLSWNSHSKSHSVHNLPQPPTPRRGSEDFDASSSRASSSMSMSSVNYTERGNETQRERLHERERGWNSPASKLPKSPAHPGKHDLTHRHSWGSLNNGYASPEHQLTRKGSAASLTSISTTDDAGASRPSSRASSMASRADYKERVKELEQERKKDREREWNKPHPKLSRSSSSLDLHKSDRVRTLSTPSRPDSAASYLSPTHVRHGSSNSPSSSRPGSPAGSISAHDVEEEIEHEVEHQRERNWNSPRPDWGNGHRRPLSPLPRSRPGSPVHISPPKSATIPRSRSNSAAHGNSLGVPSPTPRSKSPVGERHPRPRSPMPHTPAEKASSSHARPKSPLPRLHSPEKNSAFRSRFGWSFPQHKVELPPLELEQDSPQKAPPRPSSRASLSAAASTPSHIPVRSPRKNGHGPTSSAADTSDKKRSHRRSVTEFTEAIGALPPRIEVSSDDVNDELPPVPIVNSDDDFSYASEDDHQVATSTPPAKPVSLPPPEVTTTPAIEPPAYLLNGHLTPTQDAQTRPESPLVSPPLTPPDADSQPMFSLQTPPRRPQFHTPKQEFKTPPPPRGMPDLPGPPSSSDEETEEEHTPLMQSQVGKGDLTAMKTPRPPGAWLLTPAPSRQFIKEPSEPERPDSAPPEANSSTDSGLATPPATLSRASAVPLQTPAPPGGWMATPAPAPATASRRRGSLLKVRFDLESETASEGAVEHPSADEHSESRALDAGPHNADASGQAPSGGSGDGSALSASITLPESSVEPPPTPPSLRDRIRKKAPSIRVLDAYGREQVETAQAQDVRYDERRAGAPVPVEDPSADTRQPPPSSPPTPRRNGRVPSSSTPRNRSGVRVVDAMGREIEEDESFPLVDDESILSTTPLSHNEALSRMRSTLSSMKQELSDADRSSDKTVFDQHMYAALQEQCRTAQHARNKLSKSLQVVQSVEGESKSRRANHPPFRGKIGNGTSTLLPIGDADTSLTRNVFTWRFLACFLVVQLLLLAIMYRYTLVQARKVFLTTYYDSFNPDLYLYLLKPDTTHHSIPPCSSWSIYSIFSGFQRAGWKGAVAGAWQGASCAFSSYFQSTWVGWHYTQDTITHPWPPT